MRLLYAEDWDAKDGNHHLSHRHDAITLRSDVVAMEWTTCRENARSMQLPSAKLNLASRIACRLSILLTGKGPEQANKQKCRSVRNSVD